MATETFTYTGSVQEWTVPDGVEEVHATLIGAGGAAGDDGTETTGKSGAAGGRAEATFDVSGSQTLSLWVAGTPWGRSSGGAGGTPGDSNAGAGGDGGGSTEIWDDTSTFFGAADGGGGGGGGSSFSWAGGGGGGGARGGPGGAGGGGNTEYDGEDGGGSGNGGAGGDGAASNQNNATAGSPGGGELNDQLVLSGADITTGGGNAGEGEIILEYDEPVATPQNVSVDAEREDELDLSWDAVTGADEYHVYRHDASDPYNNGSVVATVSDDGSSTITYTDASLTNGRQYHYQITADSDASNRIESTPSSEVTGTTLLSPTEIDTWQAEAADELRLDLAIADNNPDGSVDVYRSEVQDIRGEQIATTDPTATSVTDTSVPDLGTYYYTVVRDTGDVTAESLQVEATTAVEPPQSVSVASSGVRSLSISWTTGNGNEQRYVLERQRLWDTFGPAESLGTFGTDTTSYADDGTLHPDTVYRYTVHAEADWDSAETTTDGKTDSAGLERSPVPPRGWHIEVDHPSSTTLTPQILDDVERRPALNEQTRIEIPVPRNDSWLSDSLDEVDVDVRAWKDGQRLPVDTLEDVELAPDRAILHAVGPKQLERNVRRDVGAMAKHELAADLLEANGLVANVDTPQTESEQTTMQSIPQASTWAANLEGINLDQQPVTISPDATLTTQDVCDPRDALGDNDGEAGSIGFVSDDAMNGGEAAFLSSNGQVLEFDITWPYDLPSERVGIALRDRINDSSAIDIYWDSDLLASNRGDGSTLGWVRGSDQYLQTYDNAIGTGIQGGDTHTLRIEVVDSSDYELDVLAVYDKDFEDTLDFPNPTASENGGGYLDGPQTKPIVDVEVDPAETFLSLSGATLEAVFDDTTGQQAVGVRNDAANSYTTASNTTTLETEFDSAGAMVQAQLTLGRYGTQNSFPSTGINSQEVSSLVIDASLDDTPLAVNQTYEGNLGDVLAEIAGDDFVWEPSVVDGQMAIEWTQPGQRSSTEDLDVVNYSVRRVASNIQRAVVKGQSQEVRDESFTADVGNAVDLEESDMVAGTDRVYDSNGVVYSRGSDYTLDRDAGTITALSGGSLSDGSTYSTDYEHKVSGEFETGDYSGDPREELVETIPELTTDRACGLAAKLIVDRASSSRYEADVQLPPTIPAGISLVEALDLEGVPGDSMAIYELTAGPDRLEARLGDRDRVRDTIEQIQRRTDALSRRV